MITAFQQIQTGLLTALHFSLYSDCVPSYVMFNGDGTTDDAGVTTWSSENTQLIYRYFYYGKTWWIMQNALQLGADTFVEQYSVETDVNAVTPPNTGWKKTVSIQAKERHANGAL